MGQCCSRAPEDGIVAKPTTAQRIAKVAVPVVPGTGGGTTSETPLSPTMLSGGGLAVNLFHSRHNAPLSADSSADGRASAAASLPSSSRKSFKSAGLAAVFAERTAAAAGTLSRRNTFGAAAAAVRACVEDAAASAPAAAPELDVALPVREVSCFVDTPLDRDEEDSDFAPWRSSRRRGKRSEERKELEAKAGAAAARGGGDGGEAGGERSRERDGAMAEEDAAVQEAARSECSVYATPCESFCVSEFVASPGSPAPGPQPRAPWASPDEQGAHEPRPDGNGNGNGLPGAAAPPGAGCHSRLAHSSSARIRAAVESPPRGRPAAGTDAGDADRAPPPPDRDVSPSRPRSAAHGHRSGNPLQLLRQATANRVKAAAAAAAAAAGAATAPGGLPGPLGHTSSGRWVAPDDEDSSSGSPAPGPSLPQRPEEGVGLRAMLSGGSRRVSGERPQLRRATQSEAGEPAAAQEGGTADGGRSDATEGGCESSGSGGSGGLSSSRSRAASALMRLRREAAARNNVAPARQRLEYVPQRPARRSLAASDSRLSTAPLAPRPSASSGFPPSATTSRRRSGEDDGQSGTDGDSDSDSDGSASDAWHSDFAPPSEAAWPPAPPPSVVQLHYYLINDHPRRPRRQLEHTQTQQQQQHEGAAAAQRAEVFMRHKAISERILSPRRWDGAADRHSGSGGESDGHREGRGRAAKRNSRARWQQEEQPPHLPGAQQQQALPPQAPPPPQPPTPPLNAPSAAAQPASHPAQPQQQLPPWPPRPSESETPGRQARTFFNAMAELHARRKARRDSLVEGAAQRSGAARPDSDSDLERDDAARWSDAARRSTVSGAGLFARPAPEKRSPLWLYPPGASRVRGGQPNQLHAAPTPTPTPPPPRTQVMRKKSSSHCGYTSAGEELIPAREIADPRVDHDPGVRAAPPPAPAPQPAGAPPERPEAWSTAGAAATRSGAAAAAAAAGASPSPAAAAAAAASHAAASGTRPREARPMPGNWRASVGAVVATYEAGGGSSAERLSGGSCGARGDVAAGGGGMSGAPAATGAGLVPLPPMPPLPPGSVGPCTPGEAKRIVMKPWLALPQDSSEHGPDTPDRDDLLTAAAVPSAAAAAGDGSGGSARSHLRPTPAAAPAAAAAMQRAKALAQGLAAPPPSPHGVALAAEQAPGPSSAIPGRGDGGASGGPEQRPARQPRHTGGRAPCDAPPPHVSSSSSSAGQLHYDANGNLRVYFGRRGASAPLVTAGSDASTVFNNELFEEEGGDSDGRRY